MLIAGSDIDLSDRANREFFCEVARRMPGGRIEQREGLLLIAGGHPSPVIVNTAYRLRPDLPPVHALERIRDFYRGVGHCFGLMAEPHRDPELFETAVAEGWREVIRVPAMLLDRPPAMPPLPVGAALRQARGDADRLAFREVVKAAFAEDDDERGMIEAAFALPRSIEDDNVRTVLVEIDGGAVACGVLMVLQRIGVVGWIGTRPEHQRRGLGSAVTAHLARLGFDLGATHSALQASPAGLPVYQRLGYREVGDQRVLFPPQSDAA
jgi:GNAT superfamily N-acetyltransferase